MEVGRRAEQFFQVFEMTKYATCADCHKSLLDTGEFCPNLRWQTGRIVIVASSAMSSFSSAAPLGFFTLAQKKDASSSSSIRNDKSDGKSKRKELTWESAVKLAHVLRHEYSSMSTNHGKQVATTLKTCYRLQSPDQGVASILHVMVAVAKKNKDRPPISSSDIVAALHSGRILIPQIQDKDVGGAGQNKKTNKEESSTSSSLPDNWQLLFIYQQLIDYFHHEDHQVGNAACQSCIKALQLVQMLSPDEEAHYFAATDRAFRHWQLKGNEPLQQPSEATQDKKKKLRKSKKSKKQQAEDAVDSTASGCSGISFIEVIDELLTPTPYKTVAAKPKQQPQQTQPPANETDGDDKNDNDNDDEDDDDDASAWSVESFIDSIDELITPVPDPSDKFEHGMILFTDGNNNTHHFQPNFLPPYGYGAKRQIILDVICTNQQGRKIKAVRPLTVPKSSTRKNGNKQPPTMIQCNNQRPPPQHTTRQHSYSSEDNDDNTKQKEEQIATAAAVTNDPGANNNSNRDQGRLLRQKFTKLFQKRTATGAATIMTTAAAN
jgi:hypothetical protein